MSDPFLSIVIPAYNEAERLGESLEEIRRYLGGSGYTAEVIAVDDGSSDGTALLLQQKANAWPQLKVLTNSRNSGKGFSVRRGVLEARGDLALFTDADLSAPVEEMSKLLSALEETGAQAAIGSRALDRRLISNRQPLRREYAGRLFNVLVRLLTGLRIRDTQCGLKLFHRAATRRAFEAQSITGFGFDPELLLLIQRFGGKVVEVPVRWDNNPATKVRFLRDSVSMLVELLALRWRIWTSRYGALGK